MGKKKHYTQTVVKIVCFDTKDFVRTSAEETRGDGINWQEYWTGNNHENGTGIN